MYFVDTNVFLSFMVAPKTSQDAEMRRRARSLFARIADSSEEATTDGVVLHEVCWILGAKSRYAVPPDRIIEYLRSMLNWPGWSFSQADIQAYLRALEIFGQNPELEFSDSLVVARAEAMGATLATFDRRLTKVYPGAVWE